MRCRRLFLLLTALSLGPAARGNNEEHCRPLMQGAAESAQTRYAQAERLLSKALTEMPGNAVILIERGRCYTIQKKYAAADADFARAAKQPVSHMLAVKAISYKASNDLAAKNWPRAVTDCTQLLQLNPYDPTAFEKRYQAYKQLGRTIEADKDKAAFNRIAPHTAAYRQVENLLNAEGDVHEKFKPAVAFFKRYLAQHPYDADAYYDLARFQAQLGQTKEALASYDMSIKYNPTRFVTIYEKANALASQKQYQAAAQAYTEAFQLGPNNEHVLLDRAACYSKMGNYANSIRDYSVLVALHPEEEDPLHYRARVYALDKQYAKALSDYNKVVELAPDQAANYSERSKILEQLGKHDLALKDTKKASELLAAPLN